MHNVRSRDALKPRKRMWWYVRESDSIQNRLRRARVCVCVCARASTEISTQVKD